MSTATAFFCALIFSVGGITYLMAIDPKRTRVFRVERAFTLPKSKAAGWVAVFLPAFCLLAVGHVSAFLAWFGALTVCAWLIASSRPKNWREN